MKIACIDLEGVLIPEIWPFVAERFGVASLSATTREEPDYPTLMARRILSLRTNSITLEQLQTIVDEIDPFAESKGFLDRISEQYEIRILSDCFHEIADGILARLGNPAALCHRFFVDDHGFITGCNFARRRGKEDVVAAFVNSGTEVLAVGDALNDIAMLKVATDGFLVRPSKSTRAAAPHIRIVERLDDVLSSLRNQESRSPAGSSAEQTTC